MRHLLQVFVCALALGGCSTGWHVERGRRAILERDLPAAEAAWRRVLDREPTHAEALYGLGWTFHLSGQDGAARPWFEQCVEVHPESPLGYKGLGSIALSEGNLALAEQRFGEALARSPGDPAIRNSLALVWLKGGDLDRAAEALGDLRRDQPGNASITLGYAEALLRTDRGTDALTIVDEDLRRPGRTDLEEASLLHLRARILVALTTDRLDPSRCAETAPPVLAWLDQAQQCVEAAFRLGVAVPELPQTRRLVLRRLAVVSETCPTSTWAPEAGEGG